jgi:putative transcriptional regulator
MSAINFTNQFLIAMPGLSEGAFAGTVIYMWEHSQSGALGLVINKPIDITLRNLFEKIDLSLDSQELAQAPVYFGGPVQTERGFVLHERLGGQDSPGGHYHSSLQIPGGLEMTTSKDVLEALSSGAGPKKVLIALGYTGWQAGQLEEEIARNGWINVAAEPAIIFETPVAERYNQALLLLGIDVRMLSPEVGHA